MKPLAVLVAAGLASAAFGADQAVPAAREPHHHIRLENAYVRTLEVRMVPGEQTEYHLHAIPSVVVELSHAQTVSHEWGKAPDPLRTTEPGDTRYAPYDVHPITHQVSNRGSTVFDVFDIEILQPNRRPAAGYPPAPPAPAQLVIDQKQVRAYRVVLDPGQTLNVPGSAAAHLVVAYEGAFDSVSASQEQFFDPGKDVSLSNSSSSPAKAILIELESTVAE